MEFSGVVCFHTYCAAYECHLGLFGCVWKHWDFNGEKWWFTRGFRDVYCIFQTLVLVVIGRWLHSWYLGQVTTTGGDDSWEKRMPKPSDFRSWLDKIHQENPKTPQIPKNQWGFLWGFWRDQQPALVEIKPEYVWICHIHQLTGIDWTYNHVPLFGASTKSRFCFPPSPDVH